MLIFIRNGVDGQSLIVYQYLYTKTGENDMTAAMIADTGAAVYIEDERMNGTMERPSFKQYLVRPAGRNIASGWVDADSLVILEA